METSLPPTPSSPSPSSQESARSRKRRKPSDTRQFPCDRAGCDRTYSRAEHLQRHQLNHDPKELFFCNIPGCDAVFVRKDLCLRHRLRHERQGLVPPQISTASAGKLDVPETCTVDDIMDGCGVQRDEPKLAALNTVSMPAPDAHSTTPTPKPSVDVSTWSMSLDQTYLAAGQSTTDCSISLSPSSTDEFTSWLFDELGVGSNTNTFNDFAAPHPRGALANLIVDPSANSFGQLWPDLMDTGYNHTASLMSPLPQAIPTAAAVQYHPTGVQASSQISETKRQEIISSVLNTPSSQDSQYAQVLRQDVLTGASEAESHVLSLASLQSYIDNYWKSFDTQLPIIHRPTFAPDAAPVLQLLAVLVVGASMTKTESDVAQTSIRRLAQHISWNLRWQVFMHPDSQPPAQLWVIQTLLLLEVHEKLRASRAQHERAHVYFPTTLTLMRRGSTLSGRHSPPAAPFSAEHGPAPLSPSLIRPVETWWDCWVAQESTRRAALTAFIIDSSHAVMFGHTPTLTIHELNLSLPCESNLWKSQSPSEIACVESSLFTNGINPVSFLEGLRKIFNAERVYTTPFGRVALVAGLLSVGWQMQQRELDRRSLSGADGMAATAGPHERWRPKLLRALDWWRRDVQESVERMRRVALDWKRPGVSAAAVYGLDAAQDDGVFLTWGNLLYHLGHITQHVAMRELCVFAGARRMLGRVVTPADIASSLARMDLWSTSLRAINAVYHALQIVKMVLRPDPSPSSTAREASSTFAADGCLFTDYQAAHDTLLPRPWALYFATLVLWAYGYSVDGAIEHYPSHLIYPALSPTDPPVEAGIVRAQQEDLATYMASMLPPGAADSVQAFHAHQQAAEMIGRRNQVVGLLAVADDALKGSSWELLDEARDRFRHAATILQG